MPTPIGNLEDITLRALRILREAALIAAEDTRTTKVLLQHYDIKTPMTSYHEHNKVGKLDVIFGALAGGDVALVSDAGTPGVSDPGYELINAAIAQGIRVEPLPGANAVLPALVASGLPTDSFVFLGFLPKKDKALRDYMATISDERRTLVAYENPYRLLETLEVVRRTLGDRRVCVAREISKMFEEFFRGSVTDAIIRFEREAPRGEITLVIAGASPETEVQWEEDDVREALFARLEAGEMLTGAAKTIAQKSGWSRRVVYAMGAEFKGDGQKGPQR